jgi:type II secretory pathway component GspD/PulD (secretin)
MLKIWIIAVAAAFAGSAVAAPVPATKGEGEPQVVKARAALNNKVTIKAENKTLNEVIDLFKEFAKAEIVLDTAAVQMLGMDANTPMISIDVKDLPLKEALTKAFAAANLRYGVTSSGLVISTDEGITVRQLRQRVSLDADGKLFPDAIKTLMNESGANVVIDPRIAKKAADEKLTLKLEDVPLETAVRLAAEVAGYSVVRMSNVLFITSEARAEKMRPDADKPVGPTPGNPFFPNGVDGGGPAVPNALPAPGGAAPGAPQIEVAPVVR